MSGSKITETNDQLINERLERIENSLNRLEGSKSILDLPSPRRTDILEVMVSQAIDDVQEGLIRNMVKRCDMKDPCRDTFNAFLLKNAALLENEVVREAVIITNQDEMNRLRETAPYDKCNRCFDEVARLFGKQVRLMRSMRIYLTTSDIREEISELPEEWLVGSVLDPIASKYRLQIMKSVSREAHTFSKLSSLTGLRGGNLLFHIEKLIETGMVVQRHDRGDYMITEKGFKVLKGVSDVYQMLEH
jgi:predicted transcriptional regulator